MDYYKKTFEIHVNTVTVQNISLNKSYLKK